MSVCYFITDINTANTDWVKHIPIEGNVNIPDRLYKYISFCQVPDMFTIHQGIPARDLSILKTCKTLSISDTISLIIDSDYGYLQVTDANFTVEDAVDLFEQLLEWKYPEPLLLFV